MRWLYGASSLPGPAPAVVRKAPPPTSAASIAGGRRGRNCHVTPVDVPALPPRRRLSRACSDLQRELTQRPDAVSSACGACTAREAKLSVHHVGHALHAPSVVHTHTACPCDLPWRRFRLGVSDRACTSLCRLAITHGPPATAMDLARGMRQGCWVGLGLLLLAWYVRRSLRISPRGVRLRPAWASFRPAPPLVRLERVICARLLGIDSPATPALQLRPRGRYRL